MVPLLDQLETLKSYTDDDNNAISSLAFACDFHKKVQELLAHTKLYLKKLGINIAGPRCSRKVMRLATLCMNRELCCLPLHMAVRLTPATDSVQFWTCYRCYAIVESVWSEVVFVRCVTKMDQQKIQQSCAIKFCVKLVESATVTYEKLQRAYGEQSALTVSFNILSYIF
jgi:hypothetical protein